jgi:hypothetical protein
MVEVPDDRQFSELKVWKFQIKFRCERCPVIRYVGIDANGDIRMSRYVYPENWKRYRRAEMPTASEFRRRFLEGRARKARRRS